MKVRGLISGRNFFSSLPRPDPLKGSPSLPSSGNQGLFPEGKQPRREADHSLLCGTEVKNA
jgi:hypothetical protein